MTRAIRDTPLIGSSPLLIALGSAGAGLAASGGPHVSIAPETIGWVLMILGIGVGRRGTSAEAPAPGLRRRRATECIGALDVTTASRPQHLSMLAARVHNPLVELGAATAGKR